MNLLFFDRLVVLENLDKQIKKRVESSEERQELWKYIDEIIHHTVMGCCLTHLPNDRHSEFLEMFIRSPYDPKLLKYLDKNTKKNMKKIIKDEIKKLTKDLLLLDSNKV